MIVLPNPNWLTILTNLKGSIARRIAKRCAMITALAALIVLIESHHPEYFSKVSATPFTLLGLSLSIFMSFRNNACYARWWEGRQQWGKLVVEVRCFVRESIAITDKGRREALLRTLVGFTHALNARLRGEDEKAVARPWLSDTSAISDHNVADSLLSNIGQQCAQLASSGQINEWRYMLLEQRLVAFSEVQGACERIKATPLPFPYSLLLHRTIYIFCLLLPFAMAQPLGWMAPIFTAIVSYTFFGLDAIGNELEDPFGRDVNDLPTDAMTRIVERDVLAALGQKSLPPLLTPVEGVLS
ncbi:bestrophin family protein [Gallaecimonas mangrovi]|uniref:bestrophin family protein n=1 Tax=Gallaecimonas mangrovi TaxID=2291597 RepID=UPI000E20167F|nr:bestrophin family protein [Gallaecimonas mangrovi]